MITSEDSGITNGDRSTSPEVQPLISVVTVVFNAVNKISETLDSVVPFLSEDVELVVVDGGSTDGTIDEIKRYRSHITEWLTEPDLGIYDAMNKAVSLAKGQYIFHLNIGDRLLRVPLTELLSQSPEVACVSFPVELSGGNVFRPASGLALNFHNTLHHQGTFYRRAAFTPYRLKYRVFSDFDLNQRIKASGGKIVTYDDAVAYHDEGGVSNTTNRFYEVYEIVRENKGTFWLAVSYMYFKWRGILARIRSLR